MKFISVLAVSILLLTFITGCSKQTYTADYLLKDTAKRKEILADCKDNKQSTENCNNANQAQAAINAQIQAKVGQIQLLKVEADQNNYAQKMFGSDPVGQNKIKAINDKIAQLKAEIDTLSKQ